ncbi:hypothetical protein BC941DRAFT_503424 [Chlamydoabsidia padenii]|nr:hypothetical protein BC941DRAFT_503424 [Chlamydoabsidia padenii]
MFPQFDLTPADDVFRRKRLKVPSACAECRRRKTKCDGAQPCASCIKAKVECRYVASKTTLKNNTSTYPPSRMIKQDQQVEKHHHSTPGLPNIGSMRSSFSSTITPRPLYSAGLSRHSFSHHVPQPTPPHSGSSSTPEEPYLHHLHYQPQQEQEDQDDQEEDQDDQQAKEQGKQQEQEHYHKHLKQQHREQARLNVPTIVAIEERLAAIERILQLLLEKSETIDMGYRRRAARTNSSDNESDHLRLPPLHMDTFATAPASPRFASSPVAPTSSLRSGSTKLPRIGSSPPNKITGFKRPHESTPGQPSPPLSSSPTTTEVPQSECDSSTPSNTHPSQHHNQHPIPY